MSHRVCQELDEVWATLAQESDLQIHAASKINENGSNYNTSKILELVWEKQQSMKRVTSHKRNPEAVSYPVQVLRGWLDSC